MRHAVTMRFIMLFLALFGPESLVAAPDIYLTYPACFPECDEQDRNSLLEGSESEQRVVAAIDRAQREIRFSIYTFSRKPIFEALLRAHGERGVVIKGLVDRAQLENLRPYCNGSRCSLDQLLPEESLAGKPLAERMAKISKLEIFKKATLVGKLQLLSFQNEASLQIKVGPGQSRLMHNKFLVIDDSLVQTSSGNWSSTAMSVNFENTIALSAPEFTPEIGSFQCAFDAIWSDQPDATSRILSQCGVKERIYFTPTVKSPDDIQTTILQNIRQAQETVAISMHHLEHPMVYEELYAAVQRGVQVKLLFDDDDCISKEPVSLKKLTHLSPSSVAIQYLPTNCALNQLSHNRFGIFDGKSVINGSANWSKAGLGSNYETFIKLDDPVSVGQFSDYFARLFEASKPRSTCGCDPKLEECRRRFCLGEFRPSWATRP